ncbi:MAG: hypothetical protein HY040_23990 [Planctomycetes bacterium]|nr:hypothetical protein [Planctomycetota bacterium]
MLNEFAKSIPGPAAILLWFSCIVTGAFVLVVLNVILKGRTYLTYAVGAAVLAYFFAAPSFVKLSAFIPTVPVITKAVGGYALSIAILWLLVFLPALPKPEPEQPPRFLW